jgi:signal transduction histidine kinase
MKDKSTYTMLISQKMNSPTITRNVTKLYSYLPPANLFSSLTPSKIVQKKPGQFVAALAHEIRNPLSNINLAVEMLKSAIREDDNQKIYLDIIMRSSVRINELINDLLKYQQVDEVQTERLSICQLLDEVVEMAKDRIMLKNIAVRKNYATRDCKMILNKQKMKIALTNIIINAIDAMGTENGELRLATKLINNRYAIQIEDNGCGISKGDLKYIFKPNYTNKAGGLGLGLAATYDILQLNHVGVNVESQKGEGTRFILLFEEKYQYTLFNR